MGSFDHVFGLCKNKLVGNGWDRLLKDAAFPVEKVTDPPQFSTVLNFGVSSGSAADQTSNALSTEVDTPPVEGGPFDKIGRRAVPSAGNLRQGRNISLCTRLRG
jgi:hypothetical protein